MAPSIQRRKLSLTPTTRLPCSKAAKTRNPLKVAGCPKLANISQPLVGRSSPYYDDMWMRYWCLTSFFPIVDTCISCEDTARQLCDCDKMAIFCVLYFQRAACRTFQTCILNSTKATPCVEVWQTSNLRRLRSVSYTHLTLPTNREV